MEAVTIISPPGGAPNSRLARVSIRPEVHPARGFPAAPWPRTMMSRSPCPSRWTLYFDGVIVSISLVPKTPWPVLYSQYLVLTPESAGPLKLSDQVTFHGGVGFPGADEQLTTPRTMSMLSPAMSSLGRNEARVCSLASYGLSARTAVRRHIPGHPSRILAVSGAPSARSSKAGRLRIRPGDPGMPYCPGWCTSLPERG